MNSEKITLNLVRKAFFFLILGISFVAVELRAQSMPAEQYRQFIGEASDISEQDSKVKTSLNAFVKDIKDRVGSSKFDLYQFTGYSGASYSDMSKFEIDFRARVAAAVQRTQLKFEQTAKTVFVLGTTTDGFGRGYEIINEMRESGEISNVIVGGMASDEAVKYHLEGAEQGWGDVISPHQDLVFLMNTYSDNAGNRSWELKRNESDQSETTRLLIVANEMGASISRMEVFEGGAQAFEEAVEFLLEASQASSSNRFELGLVYDFEPGNRSKDKGYRAATQLALLINDVPSIVPDSVNVIVTKAGSPEDKWSVSEFFSEGGPGSLIHENYSNWESELAFWKEKMEDLIKETDSPSPKLNFSGDPGLRGANTIQEAIELAKARQRQYQKLGETRATALKIVNRFASRGENLARAANRIRFNPSHPAHNNPNADSYLIDERDKGFSQKNRGIACRMALEALARRQ